ncbi:MAG: polyprenyl synthetase family protein [Thermoprotei archaeon]
MNKLNEELKFYADLITKEALLRIDKIQPPELRDSCAHLIKGGGKRLRPFVVITVGEGFGMKINALIPAALAVEYIHNFSLIHDDIIDQDEVRRGLKTVHVLWGTPMAIIAGDMLFAMAFTTLNELKKFDIPSNRIQVANNILALATQRLAIGQSYDILFSNEEYVNIDSYLKMIYLKTGALFESSSEIGAVIAGAKGEKRIAMRRFGRNIGIAFQIIDDILGVIGDEKITGKPVGNDIREGKKTLPIIYALKHGDAKIKELLRRNLGNKLITREDVKEIQDILLNTGIIDYSYKLAKQYGENARKNLAVLPNKDQKELLNELIEFILVRNY